MSVVSEKEQALNSVNSQMQDCIWTLIESYVENCIITPKVLLREGTYAEDFKFGLARVRDHRTSDSDLYLLILGIVETMQKQLLEREVAEEMFEYVLDEIYGEKEDEY